MTQTGHVWPATKYVYGSRFIGPSVIEDTYIYTLSLTKHFIRVTSCTTMEKKCYRNCDHFYFMFSTNKCLCCMSAWENTSHKHAHMNSRMNLSSALILWLGNESLLIGVRASKRISSVFAACILHVYFLEATMPLWSARMPMSLRYDDCSPKARLYGAYKLHAAVNLSQRKTSATSVTT